MPILLDKYKALPENSHIELYRTLSLEELARPIAETSMIRIQCF